MAEFDVIVVGAGIAGLSAAREIQKGGRRVLVLEARDRVGGRTMEGRLDGQPFDLGGQWVGPTQRRVMRLIGELGLETFPQHAAGYQLLEMNGKVGRYRGVIPKLPIFALLAADRAVKTVNRLAASVDPERPWEHAGAAGLDAVTAETWIRANVYTKAARELVRIGTRAIFSAEPSEMSMLFFLTYIRGGGTFELMADVEGAAQQDRIRGGAFQIARRLAAELGPETVLVDRPVRRIEQNEAGVRVIAGGGADFRARRVVVALSPNLTLGIDFAPERPVAHDALARRMPMGSVTKAIVAYDKPFWRAADMSGMAVSDRGPFGPVFDACLPGDERGYLVGFLEGEEGRRFALQTEADRKAAIVATLARWFGPQANRPLGYLEKNWTMDPWSGGCYTGLMIPGTLTAYGRQLREPFGNVHWAGTERATEWAGYFDGAVQSGQRAAAEILERLRAQDS